MTHIKEDKRHNPPTRTLSRPPSRPSKKNFFAIGWKDEKRPSGSPSGFFRLPRLVVGGREQGTCPSSGDAVSDDQCSGLNWPISVEHQVLCLLHYAGGDTSAGEAITPQSHSIWSRGTRTNPHTPLHLSLNPPHSS